jgi:biotin carboxyl carrier protein
MYFEAETDGLKYQVTVSETRTHWKVGLKPDGKDWHYHTVRKEDYMNLDETVSFLFNNSSYLVDVIAKGTDYTVYTRGTHKAIRIYNEEKLLHESLKGGGSMGSEAHLSSGMPGKIVKVFVKPGDKVKAGEPLLIMEAMKMENEMRAGRAVTVKEVKVKAGENVESGATLVTFEKQ